ncbi:unnamed protein product [Durusdinium trenchii]|uniref:Protein kinase domain-containing protein n=1 Tax=Durusdinium trenchii TaxID=1381693 RepID=A0ABP0P616_9DINO
MATLDSEEDDGKSQERAAAVFQSLCGYLVQEVSMGRTVHVPNLGLFFHAGTGQMRFKVLEKLLPADHRWEGESPGIGPIAKARVEKIAQSAGVHKDLAEEMLHAAVKDFWTAVQTSPEVELDFPGVGVIKVKDKTLTFEPFGSQVHRKKVTAEHGMFSRTAQELWKKLPQSQASLRSKETAESYPGTIPSPLSPTAMPTRVGNSEILTLHKSSSTPVLKPLKHESRGTGEVPFPQTFKDRKLASLKEDAEQLSKRFTRQLPVSERLFPPILDRCSRTRSALVRESVAKDHISNVIGANYSPKSRSLSIDHEARASLLDTLIRRKPIPQELKDGVTWSEVRTFIGRTTSEDQSNRPEAVDLRNVDWTAEWPQILEERDSPVCGEIEDIQMSKKEFCRILSRYRHYTEGGIPADVLAPYHRQWLEHAVLLLEFENPARWPMLSEEEQTNLIEELRTEILKGYIRAAKTTVVNYALLDERCRKRLDVPFIPSPPPIWGCLTFQVPDIGTPGGELDEATDRPDLRSTGARGFSKRGIRWRTAMYRLSDRMAVRGGTEWKTEAAVKVKLTAFGRVAQLDLAELQSVRPQHRNSVTALSLVDFWLKECQDCARRSLGGLYTLEDKADEALFDLLVQENTFVFFVQVHLGNAALLGNEQTPPEHPAFDGFEFLELLDVAEYPRAVAVEHEDAEEQGEELQRPSGISGRSMMSFLESLKGWTSHAFSFPKLLTQIQWNFHPALNDKFYDAKAVGSGTFGVTFLAKTRTEELTGEAGQKVAVKLLKSSDNIWLSPYHYKHLPQIRPYIDLSRAECVDLQAIHRGEDADKEAAEHVVKCLYDGISPQLRSLSDSFAPLYMVMNFVGSDDVDKWWAKQVKHGQGSGANTDILKALKSSVKGMLLGLRFLAESQTDTQWVHHDLKPQNMVVTDDTAETVLVDFGTVLSSKEPKKTLL